MRLFNGLDRTDYQDVLRAVGRLCDANHWRNLRLVECDEGLILQYTAGATEREFVTYLFGDADLEALLRDAYADRHPAARQLNAPAAPAD